MTSVAADVLDPRSRAELLLRAHEGLASLSDRNREEFEPLLAQLRQEMDALPR